MTTQTFTTELELIECANCHMPFGMSIDFARDRRRDHGSFTCPLGHSQFFPGKSDVEKLEERLAAEKRRHGWTESTLTHTRDQLQATEYSRRAEKAAKTRLKNRIAAGMCPCCRRTFQNVARHIEGQHPDFVPSPEA